MIIGAIVLVVFPWLPFVRSSWVDTANQAGEKIAVARERIQDSLHQAKVKLAEAEAMVTERARQAARYTDEYVHDNPWRAIGIAAGIGLVLGLLMSRR